MDKEFFIRLWEKITTFLTSTVHTPFKGDFELQGWVWVALLGIIVFSIGSIAWSLRRSHA